MIKWEMKLILLFNSLTLLWMTSAKMPNVSKMYILKQIVTETNELICLWAEKMHRQMHKCTRGKLNVYFIPQALILLCMSASSSALTEHPQYVCECKELTIRESRYPLGVAPLSILALLPYPSAQCLQGFPFSVQERCQTCSTIPHTEAGLCPPFTQHL